MKPEELITTEELCSIYKVERTFITSLSHSGLLKVIEVEQKEYVHSDAIGEFEKMHRLYHDLHINIEGLEAIHHLLGQVQKLQKKNRKLRNRLSIYETR